MRYLILDYSFPDCVYRIEIVYTYNIKTKYFRLRL